jgi:hypothetical protein
LNEAAATAEQRATFQQAVSRYNFGVAARMLLIGESRFDATSDFKGLRVAEISHTTTFALSASERPPRRNGKTDASGLRKTPMLPVGHIILLNIITVGPTAPIENLPSAITPSMMPSELPALQEPSMPRQRLRSMPNM